LKAEFCRGGYIEWEAEEFPLLESVAWERLVKTQQAEKGLVDAVVIC
jgi:hypothetical protein